MANVSGRKKRKRRVRLKISGSTMRPRMSVYRSLNNIYVQIVDDMKSATLTSASSIEKRIMEKRKELDKTAVSKEVGKLVAERCKSIGVKMVVFDRGGCRYIGRVAALADGAREGGLNF